MPHVTTPEPPVPIYWLNGNKVADDYADFYDGSWDDEANDKNELGNNGPDTSNSDTNYPFTGCDHDGTRKFAQLGSGGSVRVGRPNSSDSGTAPSADPLGTRPMYGLSPPSSCAKRLAATNGETSASPGFTANRGNYTAPIDAVSLTATKNDSNATVPSRTTWTPTQSALMYGLVRRLPPSRGPVTPTRSRWSATPGRRAPTIPVRYSRSPSRRAATWAATR